MDSERAHENPAAARDGEALPSGAVTVVLRDLAHDIVAAVDPDQLDYLDATTARWMSGDLPRRRRPIWTSGSVGSGIDPTLLSDVIYPLLTGSIAQVVGTGVVLAWQRNGRRRRLRRQQPERLPAPAVQVTLSADQVERLRSEMISHGVTIGVPPHLSRLQADACFGALMRAMVRPAEPPREP